MSFSIICNDCDETVIEEFNTVPDGLQDTLDSHDDVCEDNLDEDIEDDEED